MFSQTTNTLTSSLSGKDEKKNEIKEFFRNKYDGFSHPLTHPHFRGLFRSFV